MVSYNNAKIYKIVDNTNGNVYIGSTCQPTLACRLSAHVNDYKRYLKGEFHFVTSFDILENNNYEIILLEKCEGITCRDELHARERFYIETSKAGDSVVCVNKNIPNRYKREYNLDNKEDISQYKKEYIKEYNKANYKTIQQYKKKQYDDNKEAVLQQAKAYREANRDKISQKDRERYRIKKELKEFMNILLN